MNDLQYRRASDVYLQVNRRIEYSEICGHDIVVYDDPHQKPPPVTEPYQPFDHEYEEKDEEEDEEEDEKDGW